MGTNSFLILSKNLLLGSVRKTRPKQNYLNILWYKDHIKCDPKLSIILSVIFCKKLQFPCHLLFWGQLATFWKEIQVRQKVQKHFLLKTSIHRLTGEHIAGVYIRIKIKQHWSLYFVVIFWGIEYNSFLFNNNNKKSFCFQLLNSNPLQIVDITNQNCHIVYETLRFIHKLCQVFRYGNSICKLYALTHRTLTPLLVNMLSIVQKMTFALLLYLAARWC